MTAPAEDPRSGECRTCGYDEANHRREAHLYDPSPPAAGRGDTDSGGETPLELADALLPEVRRLLQAAAHVQPSAEGIP